MEFLCYFDVNWDLSQNDVLFVSLLDKYFDKYVCGREISKSDVRHYQLYLIGTQKSYTNFSQKVVKTWTLSGKAAKGGRRQYGKVKDIIGTMDSCTSYCLKDGNYKTKGFLDSYILERANASFQKEDSEIEKYDQFIEKCRLYLKNIDNHIYYPDLESLWIQPEDKITILENFSLIYFDLFKKLMPRFKLDKILMDTGLMSHRDYVHKIAKSWIYDEYENKPGGKIVRVIHCENCESKRPVYEENYKL